ARAFAPVDREVVLGRGWAGEWVCEQHGASCRIDRADGDSRVTIGIGPLRTTLSLTPLDAHRALTDRRDGPWRQRACLLLNPRAHTLSMVTNRSRVLKFRRK